MRWERHKLTGNVGMSTAYRFSILKISRTVHTLDFIVQFLYLASKFQNSISDLRPIFVFAIVSKVELWKSSSIVPFLSDFSHELHEDPSFASITVHEEVVDLVDVVRLLDGVDKVLLAAIRSFHLTFEYFFCRDSAWNSRFLISA